jgi:hypothetical protein
LCSCPSEFRADCAVEDYSGLFWPYNLQDVGTLSSIETIVPSSQGRSRVRQALRHRTRLERLAHPGWSPRAVSPRSGDRLQHVIDVVPSPRAREAVETVIDWLEGLVADHLNRVVQDHR